MLHSLQLIYFGVCRVIHLYDVVLSEFLANENSSHGFVAHKRWMTGHIINLFRAAIMETCTDAVFWILLQSLREKQVSYLIRAFITYLCWTPRTMSVASQLYFQPKALVRVGLLEEFKPHLDYYVT